MRQYLLIAALGLGLSSCTYTDRSNTGLNESARNLIAGLTTDRGEASTYQVGDRLRVRLSVRENGYVTLVGRRADGTATLLARNIYVERGTATFPQAEPDAGFAVVGPEGLQSVRAVFTLKRPTTDLVIGGVYDDGRWNTVGQEALQGMDRKSQDVQETYYYVKQP